MTTRWYAEKDPFSPINYRYSKPRLLYSTESAFQHIQIMETEFFGRMLVLDDVVQLTERDEFLYHEMLAHVPLHAHPLPSTALVIGGGDGGTLREVLRHPTVKQATLVELDPKVIQAHRRCLLRFATGESAEPGWRGVPAGKRGALRCDYGGLN